MGIFAGRHPKVKVMNDDGIERDQYYPLASGSSVQPIRGVPVDAWGKPAMVVSDDLVNQLWERMYSQPVLVRCAHCNSVNVVTSPVCVQCGAPMGDCKRFK